MSQQSPPPAPSDDGPQGDPWHAFGYIVSGVGVYGVLGWLADQWLGTGFLVFCGVAVPWYLTLSLFEGVDDEGKGFFYRFFIHDHLNRLTAGVHTTRSPT